MAPDISLINFNPSCPGEYGVFDPETLSSTEHRFSDALRIDVANLTPMLDVDQVSYNSAWPGGPIRSHRGGAAEQTGRGSCRAGCGLKPV